MRKSLLLLVSAILLFSTPLFSQYDGYELVWSDEFSENGPVNPENWFHQTLLPNGNSWYNGELQHYTDRVDNSYVENGLLKIVARRETFIDQEEEKEFTSARLNSKYAFRYGRVDVRARLPVGNGTWPAIWSLGRNIIEPGGYWTDLYGDTAWPACGEIDIMEHWGNDPNIIHGSIHTPSSFGTTVNTNTTEIADVGGAFHDYSIIWDENEIQFLVDDAVFYTYNPLVKNTETWPFDEPQYLLLNIAMGGIGGVIDLEFTESTMEVDYVRVYERTPPVANQPVTFEPGEPGDGWSWTMFDNVDNPALSVVDNPDPSGMNTSNKVAQLTTRLDAEAFAGAVTTDIGAFNLDETNHLIKVLVWKTVISDVGVKLEQGSTLSTGEIRVSNTVVNQWEELTFDFSSVIGNPINTNLTRLVIFPDFDEARTVENITYFDDITFTSDLQLPTVPAPNPIRATEDVVSIYSDNYADVSNLGFNLYGAANFEKVFLNGNGVLKYTFADIAGGNFQIIELGADEQVDADALGLTHFHFDLWFSHPIDESSEFLLKLVDIPEGGSSESFITISPTSDPVMAQGVWIPFDFTFTELAAIGLTGSSNLQQVVIDLINTSAVYIDNIYFYKRKADATLSSIEVDGVAIADFEPATLEYVVELPFGTTQVPSVTASTTDANANVEVTEASALPGTTTLLVTAEDGLATSTYTVGFTLLPPPSTDATLSSIEVDGVAIADFEPATLEYVVELPFGTTQVPSVTASTTDGNANVELTEASALPGTTTLLVTAEDGLATSTYTVGFTLLPPPSTDATLSSIEVDGVAIADFEPATLEYVVELPFGTTQVPSVTASTTDANANVELTEASALPGTTTLLVTAEDGLVTSTYTVGFTLLPPPSTDATLSSIEVDGVAIADFEPATLEYVVELPFGTTQVPSVTASTTDANANVEVTEASALPGTTTLLVTAEDGLATSTYTVGFTLLPPPSTDATLSSIEVDGVAIADFEPATLEYVVELPFGTTQVPSVTASTTDGNANVEVTEASALPGTTTLLVTAEDGLVTSTYTVGFTLLPPPSTDATLSSIEVDGVAIADFEPATLEYVVELPFGTTQVPSVTASTTDANANVEVTEASALPGTTTLLVTAEDGLATSTYTVSFILANEVLGLDDHSVIEVFPNPSSSEIRIVFKGVLKPDNYAVTIKDINGKSYDVDSMIEGDEIVVEIGHFADGTYLLILQKDGNIRYSKFVKK